MSARRLVPFLLINVVVSAIVVLAILLWWDSRNGDRAVLEAETPVAPAAAVATLAIDLSPTMTTDASEGEEATAYVVKAGDTLGSISGTFDVSVEDIMLANGLSDPNLLQVNQELIIPIGGFVPATPTTEPTLLPGVVPSPVATEPLDQGEVIVEITRIESAGRLADEAVAIANFGAGQADLENWQIVAEDGQTFTFGQVMLFGGGAEIVVHSTAGDDGPSSLYWGLDEAVWLRGETVTVKDAQGTVQSTFQVP